MKPTTFLACLEQLQRAGFTHVEGHCEVENLFDGDPSVTIPIESEIARAREYAPDQLGGSPMWVVVDGRDIHSWDIEIDPTSGEQVEAPLYRRGIRQASTRFEREVEL